MDVHVLHVLPFGFLLTVQRVKGKELFRGNIEPLIN